MSHRSWFVAIVLVCSPLTVHRATADADVQPKHGYDLHLRARQPDEKEFTRASLSLDVGVFLDRDAGRLFYITGDGKTLAVVAAAKDAGGDDKKPPQRSHRLLLPVRGWEEKAFADKTPRVSVEVYRDENTGNLVYVSHTGSVAIVAGVKVEADKPAKDAKWLDRLRLKVRTRDDDFSRAPLRCNVEVYRDENTGCVVYVADNGALAVATLKKDGAGKETAEPQWSHAVGCRARPHGEEDFTPETPEVLAEVYRDENRAAWVYATSKLGLAVTPPDKQPNQDKIAAVVWVARTRPAKDAGGVKWSAEQFTNPNTGDVHFATAAGAFAVPVPAKP